MKSISISIFKNSLFRIDIDINIDIFDIETDILLHKDPKKGHQEAKKTNLFFHFKVNNSIFHKSISISILISQQCLFRNQYRYRYFHDGNSNSIPISISIFSKIFDINTNIHFEPISIAYPCQKLSVRETLSKTFHNFLICSLGICTTPFDNGLKTIYS